MIRIGPAHDRSVLLGDSQTATQLIPQVAGVRPYRLEIGLGEQPQRFTCPHESLPGRTGIKLPRTTRFGDLWPVAVAPRVLIGIPPGEYGPQPRQRLGTHRQEGDPAGTAQPFVDVGNGDIEAGGIHCHDAGSLREVDNAQRLVGPSLGSDRHPVSHFTRG